VFPDLLPEGNRIEDARAVAHCRRDDDTLKHGRIIEVW
jgi:hypothetical protein